MIGNGRTRLVSTHLGPMVAIQPLISLSKQWTVHLLIIKGLSLQTLEKSFLCRSKVQLFAIGTGKGL